MTEIQEHALPLPKQRPLVTFALFAYNQEKYIEKALQGAFSQEYRPLQIIISDDCSQDNTYEIITSTVQSWDTPYEVEILTIKNPSNLGIGEHINKIVELSKGELIVVAAGDDVSRPERTTVIVDAWINSNKKNHAICSDVIAIDDQDNVIERMNGTPFFGSLHEGIGIYYAGALGCSMAWSKTIFEKFGNMLPDTVFEDRVLLLRGAIYGEIGYAPEALVLYRQHDNNISKYMKVSHNFVIDQTLIIHRRNLNVINNYIKDLEIARNLCLSDFNLLSSALNFAKNKKANIENKIKFLKANKKKQLAMILNTLFEDPVQAIKWMIIYAFPNSYIRSQARSFGVE